MNRKAMTDPESLLGSSGRSESILENRRSEVRYSCRFKCYYTTIEDEKRQLEGGETWLIGKTVDVSLHGIALIIRRPYVPGTIVVIAPLLSGWNQERELLARVAYVRRETDEGWRVGCELVRALTQDELVFLVGNAE
jgi:hypothetical protein